MKLSRGKSVPKIGALLFWRIALSVNWVRILYGYTGVHSENDIEDEVVLMNFCYENDIPVPRLLRPRSGRLYEKTSRGQCYAVMEYVDGDSPRQFTQDMTVQIAETMARMHMLVADFKSLLKDCNLTKWCYPRRYYVGKHEGSRMANCRGCLISAIAARATM
jgi:hypothetical protein